jgi:hypothetical protein
MIYARQYVRECQVHARDRERVTQKIAADDVERKMVQRPRTPQPESSGLTSQIVFYVTLSDEYENATRRTGRWSCLVRNDNNQEKRSSNMSRADENEIDYRCSSDLTSSSSSQHSRESRWKKRGYRAQGSAI